MRSNLNICWRWVVSCGIGQNHLLGETLTFYLIKTDRHSVGAWAVLIPINKKRRFMFDSLLLFFFFITIIVVVDVGCLLAVCWLSGHQRWRFVCEIWDVWLVLRRCLSYDPTLDISVFRNKIEDLSKRIKAINRTRLLLEWEWPITNLSSLSQFPDSFLRGTTRSLQQRWEITHIFSYLALWTTCQKEDAAYQNVFERARLCVQMTEVVNVRHRPMNL